MLKFEVAIDGWTRRRFCVTENGYIGWVPQRTRVGDLVYMFLGGQSLYIVRPVLDSKAFTLIGECYLFGLMKGELKPWTGEGQEDITLV